MNKQGKDYFEGLGWVYYDWILTKAFNKSDEPIRKFYKLERFAVASVRPLYGWDEKENRLYRKYFQKKGYDMKEYIIHHGLNGRMYLIPKAIHELIPHYGYASLVRKA